MYHNTFFYITIIIYYLFNLTIVNAQDTLLDEWVIKLEGGHKRAVDFAQEHDLQLFGTVGSIRDHYRFKISHNRKKRMVEADEYDKFENKLKVHPDVLWIERQKLLIRTKRDYVVDETHFVEPTDPLWADSWYMNRHMSSREMPDMNVTSAWAQGYTGRGVSVTFLDDGFERDHPDLIGNYDPDASHDFNDNDSDPMPRYDDTNENKHGTRCAGEVGATANNKLCNTGIAFNARIGGIRMLDGDVNDGAEAASLSFNKDHISIYSSSWGPDDNGEVVDGPGPLAKKAIEQGVNEGRNGKGSVFIWASGNGGRNNDSCACDGYASSIYTFSISSTTEKGEKPWYLEECASTLATTYSSGHESSNERSISTTDLRHRCTKSHTGTSASAPMAAAIIALALEANPNLTWRDIMFLIVLTSRPKAIPSNNYFQNKRGFLVSNRYGYGLMDAGRMVELAKNWVTVPPKLICSTQHSMFIRQSSINTKVVNSSYIVSQVHTDGCKNTINEINYIEQTEIVITLESNNRGDLEINLTSPEGTRSLILPKRSKDKSRRGFNRWSFNNIQLFGENPSGTWTLEIYMNNGNNPTNQKTTADLREFYLSIHGTKEKPVDYENLMYSDLVKKPMVNQRKFRFEEFITKFNTTFEILKNDIFSRMKFEKHI